MYKILNKLIEQPFFKKIVEMVKFFKLQKTYWSVAYVIIFFLISQMVALIKGSNIEEFTQKQIENPSIDFIEKMFWYAIEFIFANGSWWAFGLGLFLLLLISLVRLYETKYSKLEFIDSILYNKSFESFDFFKYEIKQSSENIEYIYDKRREEGIAQIREEINKILISQTSTFMRIEGFSGIGKTRFVYEALNDEKYKKFVLYVQSFKDSILDDLKIFFKKLPANREIIIFVIDECPYEEHVQICRSLNQFSNLAIVTIDQVLSQQDKTNCKDEKRITLEGLSEIERVKLIQEVNSVLSEDTARKIAYYTEGYPRLAKFMAESYDVEKGDTNDFNEKTRLLDGILEKVTANKVEDIKILQAISIFKMFPNSDEFKTYKSIIFEHLGIDNSSASISIKNFIKKGIVREAGRFLYISPRPISIHLFNQFIEINDYDFIDKLFQKLNNEGLMNSFFEKLQGVQFDTSQHKDLLFQILSKVTYEQLSNGFGSKVFYTLCLKDRNYSIRVLKKLLKDKTKEDLLQLEDGRRYLIFALEELIAFRDTFVDSAKILFQLARAENESWGNNSKGIFVASFQWILGGTEVNIVNRLELLKSLYENYKTDEDRLILLEALKTSYPQNNYMATHKNHSNFPEDIPEHYHPETQVEIDAYFEKLKELIILVYDVSSQKVQSKILNDLVHSSRMMMDYSQINIWILDFIEKSLIEHPQLKTLVFEEISMIIKYDKNEELSQEIVNQLENLYNQFIKTDKIEDVKELFFKTDKYRYNSEETFESHCKVIAQDIFKNKNFDGLLDKNSSNVFDIGRELADIDKECSLYKDILNLVPMLNKDSNDRFILAYLFNSTAGSVDNYDSLFHEIYKRLNDKSLMFNFIHFSKPTEASIKYLYSVLEKNEVDSLELENFTFGFWLRDFTKNDFIYFIDKINSIIENKCDSFNLCMQYIHTKNDKELVEKYTVYYLEHTIFHCSSKSRITHYIDEMINKYFSYNLELTDKLLSSVWEAILDEFDKEGRFEERGFRTIYKIIQKYPNFFWEKLKNRLDELKPETYPSYNRFLDFMQGGYMARTFKSSIFGYIDSTRVIKWLKTTNYKEAKYIVADSLNIDFESNTLPNIVLQLLTEFPDDEDLYSSIKNKSESWSGSYVPVANEKISNINLMLETYKDKNSVVDFLKWVKKGLEYRRDREQIRDEERNI
ncbi:MAG: hypothetical protein WC656_00555 [Sulfurimonas sp.]|jgi:hypothetical protein